MRRKLTLTAVAAATVTIGAASLALAHETPFVSTCLRSTISEGSGCQGFPSLIAKFGGRVEPRSLPRHEMAPVAIELVGKVSTDDGTHPSALREVTIDFDRNIAVNATGLPICRGGGRDWGIGTLRKACRRAIVGEGKVDFEIALPENAQTSAQIPFPSNLTIYNGGQVDGVMTLYAVTFVGVPAPRTIVIPIGIKKVDRGRYGLHAVAKIPVVAGGSGSLLDFRLEVNRLFSYRGVQRSLATARCPDGQLDAQISALFKNEALTPGVPSATAMKGTVVLPCTPKG
jgi:hypothetical protein